MELYKLLNLFKNEMKQPRILLSSLWTLFLCVFLSCSIVKADPFSVPVTYPYIPAVILSEVKISGQYAEAGDQVAAYVDSELRGVSSVIVSDGKAYVSLMVNVNGASEEATFKIYDASSESILNLTLDGATSATVTPAGSIGSGASPALLSTVPAFGTVVTYPSIPASVVGEVKISGQYAEAGDQVAAYVGSELRGVSSVVVSGGKAYVSLLVNVDGASEEATFKVHDMSLNRTLGLTLDSATAVTVTPAGSIGSGASPVLLSTGAIAPAMTISATNQDGTPVSSGSTTADGSLTVTFTASVPTTDFEGGDVDVSNGIIISFSATSSTVYTATFTPDSYGAATIDVAADKFTDAGGSANESATQFSWTYQSDTVASNSTPSISASTYTVAENVSVGASVGTKTGTDADGDTLAYTITAGNSAGLFAIDSSDGKITVAKALDYETATFHSLTVKATDSGSASATATVTVNVTNVSDVTPSISASTFTVAENVSVGATVGTKTGTE